MRRLWYVLISKYYLRKNKERNYRPDYWQNVLVCFDSAFPVLMLSKESLMYAKLQNWQPSSQLNCSLIARFHSLTVDVYSPITEMLQDLFSNL